MSKGITRGLLAVGIAAVGLAFTPGTARADDFVDFTVHEAIPALAPSTNPDFTADKLNGLYTEQLTFNFAPGSTTTGTFTAVAFANFSAYGLNGGAVNNSDIGGNANTASTYRVNSSFSATGTFTISGTQQTFVATSGMADVYLDPLNNTAALAGAPYLADPATRVDDVLILHADTMLTPGSGGQFDTATTPNTGNFNFVLLHNVLTSVGQAYWPTLANMIFSSTVNGDFDSVVPGNPEIISGDVSAQFTVIPEPASLTLLGLGLASAAGMARRRKAAAQGTDSTDVQS